MNSINSDKVQFEEISSVKNYILSLIQSDKTQDGSSSDDDETPTRSKKCGEVNKKDIPEKIESVLQQYTMYCANRTGNINLWYEKCGVAVPPAYDISTKSAAELKTMCRERGLEHTGKKQDLQTRLMKVSGILTDIEFSGAKLEKKKKQTKIKGIINTNVYKNVSSKHTPLKISVDAKGRYVHSHTGLVFDKESSKVYAIIKEGTDEIVRLKPKDIELCKQYGFQYTNNIELPPKKLEDVIIEGLEEFSEDNEEE
jgi:hypothetical protein